ncbi:MAG TPA: alpha/beta hydrolase [Mucilaginibacter sp.]|nr:alpha/beta hydrolase [Mucilaginibacter sp.]
MKLFFKIFLRLAGICFAIYVAICIFFYSSQEKILFMGDKISTSQQFNFQGNFKEFTIKTTDGNKLSAVLFKANKPKGLIFYLHGNAGSINSWYTIAQHYNDSGYDVFLLDYPGYGKSTGHITSQQQLLDAIKTAYNQVKIDYPEDHIVIVGYSIGTGPATWLASKNHPEKLILLAPYFSIGDMMNVHYSFLPGFILKYPIPTYQYLQHATVPVTIFHGDQDETIYYGSSLKLKQYFKPGDTLITLKGQQHNGIEENEDYITALKEILP